MTLWLALELAHATMTNTMVPFYLLSLEHYYVLYTVYTLDKCCICLN